MEVLIIAKLGEIHCQLEIVNWQMKIAFKDWPLAIANFHNYPRFDSRALTWNQSLPPTFNNFHRKSTT